MRLSWVLALLGFAAFALLALAPSGCAMGGPQDPDAGADAGPPPFYGVCLGWKREFWAETNLSEPCAAHFNDESVCKQVEGCNWAGTYCSGFPKPCWNYSIGDCILAPGCKWYATSMCDSVESCNQRMFVTEGGCAGVGDTSGACCGNVTISVGKLCGKQKSESDLDCSALPAPGPQ